MRGPHDSGKLVITVIIVCLLVWPSTFSAQDPGDSFRLPIDNYSIGANYFGNYRGSRIRGATTRHTAEDVNYYQAGTSVRAIANGIVRYSRAGRNPCDGGWGFVVVVEHETVFGSICSVYGHVQSLVAEGNSVRKGDVIAQIAHYLCIPGGDHLHFGIHNGPFGVAAGRYPPWLNGYMTPGGSASFPGAYFKPSDFIAYQSTTITNPSWNFLDRSGANDRAQELVNTQGWIPYAGASTIGFDEPGAWIIACQNDPQLISPPLSISAANLGTAEVRMASEADNIEADLFFTTDSSAHFTFDKRYRFRITGGGAYNTYSINLRSNPTWRGIIKRLRLDPVVDGNGDVVGVQSVRLVSEGGVSAPAGLHIVP